MSSVIPLANEPLDFQPILKAEWEAETQQKRFGVSLAVLEIEDRSAPRLRLYRQATAVTAPGTLKQVMQAAERKGAGRNDNS